LAVIFITNIYQASRLSVALFVIILASNRFYVKHIFYFQSSPTGYSQCPFAFRFASCSCSAVAQYIQSVQSTYVSKLPTCFFRLVCTLLVALQIRIYRLCTSFLYVKQSLKFIYLLTNLHLKFTDICHNFGCWRILHSHVLYLLILVDR